MHSWELFLADQEQEFGKETIDRWLRSLRLIRFDACNLYLEARDSFQILWFEEHIRPKLKKFFNNNHSLVKVHLAIAGAKKPDGEKLSKLKSKKLATTATFTIAFEELDPSQIFEQFITTPDNLIVIKLLEELCGRLTETGPRRQVSTGQITTGTAFTLPTNSVNPIYIHGPEGSGKTHLLMACAHQLRALGYQVLYARMELFTDHVVRAIRAAEMSKFREIYRKADILLIDNVDELAKRAATQEEFFHTFNTLHTAGKQIILSAHCSPQQLQFIEPRLVSRFEWGISLPLYPLDKKEIFNFVTKRSQFLDCPLHSRTIEFIAESFPLSSKSANRAIQALLLRTHLHQKNPGQEKQPITLAQAKALLTDLIEEEKSQQLTPKKIIQTVAEFYGIRVEDITGKSQSRECVLPRQISMHLCRHLLKLPYMKIGDLFTRDHSTVMTAIRQVDKQMNTNDNELRSTINSIEQKLF